MGNCLLSDEPRCGSRQETSYKITRGNSVLSIATLPQGNETLDTATMPSGSDTLDTATMPPGIDTLDTATVPPGSDTLDTTTMPPGNDTPDTVTMARKEREKNGPWEAELSYRGETDLHEHLTGCEKNPGHVDFIPVDQFNVEYLPPRYQDNDVVELVKAMSDLTVRVSVKYISDKRPETVPGSGKPYPCYKHRVSNLMRVGSGWVKDVITFRNEGENCDCKECLNSEKPRTNFALIEIGTAAHVVYDELEGAHTTCHLFFDRGTKPDACCGVVTLRGMTRVTSYPKRDWSMMTYVTHDLDIVDKLYNMVVRFDTLQDKIKNKYKKIQDPSKEYVLPIIIVSHPHGCSKQVSVGSYEIVTDFSPYQLLYTTSTCPGTSGARVWTMYDGTWVWSCHSGHDAEWTLKSGKGLNFSFTLVWIKKKKYEK